MILDNYFVQVPALHAWSAASLKLVNDQLEGQSPKDVLRWGLLNFRTEIALATGFGPEGVVLMHMLSKIAPETTVFYLDTDLLFPETYALRDALAVRLGLTFTRVATGLSLEAQAEAHGARLWARDPNLCCYLRKVQPLRQYLATRQAWISGIRRDQTRSRAAAGLVEWDEANGLVKLNPLAAWTQDDVWAYVQVYELPFNPLHAQGYSSIGCTPCTRPIAPGEDARAGRWPGFAKTECGIHPQIAEPLELASAATGSA